MTPSWQELLRELTSRLGGNRHEARLILLSSTELPWSYLAAHLGEQATPLAVAAAHRNVARRQFGEPLQWVLGTWGFRTIEVAVDGRALIPRPETEIVVETALQELDRMAGPAPRQPRHHPQTALDLGTGSGVIALSIAVERPFVEVVAVDRSPAALSLATENLERLAAETDPSLRERVRFLESDWYSALELGGLLPHSFAVIVANPPYLAETEWAELDPVVREHDPYEALVSGPAGTEATAAVLEAAPEWLRPDGAVVIELAPALRAEVEALAVRAGLAEVEIRDDLAGRERVLVARREGGGGYGRRPAS